MSKKHTLSISEARKRIFEFAEAVQQPDTYYILTDKGRAKAVLMSMDDFESWEETLDIYEHEPGLLEELKEVERDIKSGAYKGYPNLEEVLAKQGFVVADKSRKTYEVPRQAKAKSRKKTR